MRRIATHRRPSLRNANYTLTPVLRRILFLVICSLLVPVALLAQQAHILASATVWWDVRDVGAGIKKERRVAPLLRGLLCYVSRVLLA